MVTLLDLALPIGLSAVFVFVASSVIHMVLRYHNPDYRKLPTEDEVGEALRKGGTAPGQYVMPNCLGEKNLHSPEVDARYAKGPVAVLWVAPNAAPNMGKLLASWLVYTLVISVFAGYLASHTVARGASDLAVFRVVGTVA